MIIGITTTLNEADNFQRVNVEYIERVAATGAVPILLSPIRGGAEVNREHARRIIEIVDGLIISGGGDIHPRYYVPEPEADRDAMAMDDLRTMHCGSSASSRCRSTGAKVPFCGHYVPDSVFANAMNEAGDGALAGNVDAQTQPQASSHDLGNSVVADDVTTPNANARPQQSAGADGQGSSASLANGQDAIIPRLNSTTQLDGRPVQTPADAIIIPCLDGLLAVCEDRDGFELELARMAHERNIPTLGICRGMQIMNVALGGSLYRDLYNCGVTTVHHRQEPPYDQTTGEVVVAQDSQLSASLGVTGRIPVNSMHHQGVDHVAGPLVVSARSTDRIVEAVEDPKKSFYMGVQWHPEYLERHTGLFQSLATAAESFANRR